MKNIKTIFYFFVLNIASVLQGNENSVKQKILFLGLHKETFLSSSFIKKEDKILLVDKSTALIHTEKIAKYGRVIVVDDYYNSGEVTLAAIKCFKDTPYTALIALSESDILRAGAIRDYLHIKCQSLKSAKAFRDKILMKNILESNGIKTAPFKLLKNEIDLIYFIQDKGYPVIVKPRKAYGAVETYVLKNKNDLEKLLKTKGVFDEFQSEKYLVESFISGSMYHIDGLVYDNEIVFICPNEYTSTCLEMDKKESLYRKGYSASYILPQDSSVAKELIFLTKRVLDALPTPKSTAFFLEVFRKENGELIVCEIASRVGGHPNPHVLWNAFAIDLKEEFIRVQAGFSPSFSWKEKPKYLGSIALGTTKGKFKGLSSSLKEFKEKNLFIDQGNTYEISSGFLSLAAYFIIPAPNKSIFIKEAENIASSFYSKDCWNFE
ncbi:MAG: ATP-grasp domain-containing protein [Bacteroidota bacterium]